MVVVDGQPGDGVEHAGKRTAGSMGFGQDVDGVGLGPDQEGPHRHAGRTDGQDRSYQPRPGFFPAQVDGLVGPQQEDYRQHRCGQHRHGQRLAPLGVTHRFDECEDHGAHHDKKPEAAEPERPAAIGRPSRASSPAIGGAMREYVRGSERGLKYICGTSLLVVSKDTLSGESLPG